MDISQAADLLAAIAGSDNVKINEPMSIHTSFKVGGPADLFVKPGNAGQLAEIIKICGDRQIPVFIMGNGTNLIVREKGIRGVVIKVFDNISRYTVNGNFIEAEAGILLSKLSKLALENELSGLEFASGIPGTLGGAVAMNAGAYGGEMKDVVVSTEFIDMQGNICTINGISR